MQRQEVGILKLAKDSVRRPALGGDQDFLVWVVFPAGAHSTLPAESGARLSVASRSRDNGWPSRVVCRAECETTEFVEHGTAIGEAEDGGPGAICGSAWYA
jgi:hypothetical protein